MQMDLTPKAMVKLMKTLIKFPDSVVIGSRFVKGGDTREKI